jgi:phage tail-like protein
MTSRPLNSDPLRNFRFQVSINHPNIPTLVRLGFMAVSGLSMTNEVIPYREGGDNTTTRKMPGQSDFGPISCSRGFMAAPVMTTGSAGANAGTNELYEWFTQIFAVNVGGGFGNATTNFRVGVTIDVMQHPITTTGYAAGVNNPPPIKARFQVYNAWPMGLTYSDLEAGGNAVIIENLSLAHEGWQLLVPSGAQNPGTFLSSSLQI